MINYICELCCFANECLLPCRYAHFHSFPPSLSARCNLILPCSWAPPPPGQLTFPLIHSEVPLGVNNSSTVYDHCTTSTGLIKLITVADRLTEKPTLLLILFTGMLSVIEAVSRSGEEYRPRLDTFSLCVAQAHTASSLSVFFQRAFGMLAQLRSGFYQLPVTGN